MIVPPLDDDMRDRVCRIAMNSAIAVYEWDDRGQAPPGYTQGMAIAFSTAVRKWRAGASEALEMAKADTHNADTDALSWYGDVFNDLEMDVSRDGLDTLRALFVLMFGLGMRESSGQHCEGRDMSADNVTSDTAEAGLFQMSWNMATCHPDMDKLLDEYSEQSGACALETFEQGVECSSGDWQSYGSGDGKQYQDLAKACPQFAVETAAIGLRNRRQHWGPINRYEAEVRPEADEMLAQVQALFTGEEVERPPLTIVISSGHGLHIRGASGYIDEVDEARRVVERVADHLRVRGVEALTFHDDVSTTQSENLERIADYHNAQNRNLDISVHFNAYQTTDKPMGTEVLWVTQEALAGDVAEAISEASDLFDRGPKRRTDLYFLNNTEEPAILIEVCFVDSSADVELYGDAFDAICNAIAVTVSGQREPIPPVA